MFFRPDVEPFGSQSVIKHTARERLPRPAENVEFCGDRELIKTARAARIHDFLDDPIMSVLQRTEDILPIRFERRPPLMRDDIPNGIPGRLSQAG